MRAVHRQGLFKMTRPEQLVKRSDVVSSSPVPVTIGGHIWQHMDVRAGHCVFRRARESRMGSGLAGVFVATVLSIEAAQAGAVPLHPLGGERRFRSSEPLPTDG